MNNAILNGIKDLQDKIVELEIDLSVAEEQAVFYKSKAARIKSLEAEIKTLKAENLTLNIERENVLKSL